MSQFDRYTKAEYVEGLRVFLKLKKKDFLTEHNLVPEGYVPRAGRLPGYSDGPVAELEAAVNAKAARAEAEGLSQGERIRIARDYAGMTDADIAKKVGVSRELVRLWGENAHRPNRLPELAEVLNVPQSWLEFGGEVHLPANSHIGVRVGAEALVYREMLYSRTLELVAEIPEEADGAYAQAYIEWAILNKDDLRHVARRAGGRWQAVGGTLLFAPWVPIPEHGITRRYWSDEVETIIQEELATKPSVYGAWKALETRCKAMGLTEDQYPKKISLHKRVEKERERIQKFGVNVNAMVAESVERYKN